MTIPRSTHHLYSPPWQPVMHLNWDYFQSPLLHCRRNISFPANSYTLKRQKFHMPGVQSENGTEAKVETFSRELIEVR